MDVFIHPRFDTDFQKHRILLVDVGARGGLKRNWAAAKRHLHLVGFEPDKREFSRLADGRPAESSTTFLDVALHNQRGPIRFNIARDRGLSSIFEPDRTFLDAFPEANRFDIVEVQPVEADTLDNQLRHHRIADVDFIKADTQGSELFVLEGARHALSTTVIGVEVEVEFAPIYRGQPLFADVDGFLRSLGFVLFDLRPCYWKRESGRGIGGPRGQIVWADALYLKSIPALASAAAPLDPAARKAKILKSIAIALLYGYCDYAIDITRASGSVLSDDERTMIETQLRDAGEREFGRTEFPGRRPLAAVLHRLWKIFQPRDRGWSVSSAQLGNHSR
jgi:FkbM family methyltransferase